MRTSTDTQELVQRLEAAAMRHAMTDPAMYAALHEPAQHLRFLLRCVERQSSREALVDFLISHRVSVKWTEHSLIVGRRAYNLNTMRKLHGDDPLSWLLAAVRSLAEEMDNGQSSGQAA